MISINARGTGPRPVVSQETKTVSNVRSSERVTAPAAEPSADPLEKAIYRHGMTIPEGYNVVTLHSANWVAKRVVGQRDPDDKSSFHLKDPETGETLALLKWTSLDAGTLNNRFEFGAGRNGWMMAAQAGLEGAAGISNAREMEEYICANPKILALMDKPKGQCYECALTVEGMLKSKDIEKFTRAMFIWDGKNDHMPKTHYVVVAKVGKQRIAIDPTGAQFKNVDANIDELSRWASEFKSGFSPATVIKYIDAPSAVQSTPSVHSFFGGTPASPEVAAFSTL